MDYVEAHPKVDWDWDGIYSNPNITHEFIQAHPEVKWDDSFKSITLPITMDQIQNCPQGEDNLDWSWISQNPHMTVDIIEQYPDKPWDWSAVSSNKFDVELRQLEAQYKIEINKLAKCFYWNVHYKKWPNHLMAITSLRI